MTIVLELDMFLFVEFQAFMRSYQANRFRKASPAYSTA